MLAKAESRKFELERVRETQILKQIEAEKEIYGEKPQYTTSKYKDHLKERKKWEEEQEREDALDEDVTTKQDMTGFHYSNYFNAIGDRLVDTDPLTMKHNKEEQHKAITQETKAPVPANNNEQKEKVAADDAGETKQSESPENAEESNEPPVLTREEKIEQARKRYFERLAKKQKENEAQ